jgi:hypothetical protein
VLPSLCGFTPTPRDDRANWGGEAVAAAKLGADKIAIFAKSLAQREDLSLEVFLGDNDAWPHPAEKLVFRDQRSVRLQQRQEKIEGARPQLYRDTAGNQLPLAQQNAETTKFECSVGCHRVRPAPGSRRIIAMHQLRLV